MSTKKKANMKLLGFLVLVSMVEKSHQIICQSDYRRPEYSDISVYCGTSSIGLAILVCPIIYTGYNESLLILNQMFHQPECEGTLDESANPPVVRFTFPLNLTHSCGSNFLTTGSAGTGIFSDFSNIEMVNISGMVHSFDPTQGMVTYNAELKYFYSCAYPLEYLINNTKMDVSSSSIAVSINNGSFISTLKMTLFRDVGFSEPLTIPKDGLELRTDIYVAVDATNLTAQYNVHLDRCYTSMSPYPTNSSYFNLFVMCDKDPMTSMYVNGESQSARFSFKAFRFIEQQNEIVSTYYIHCIARLCDISTCGNFKCSSRRRRDTQSTGISDPTTLSSTIPIVTKNEIPAASKEEAISGAESNSGSTVGLAVAVGVLVVVVVVAVGAAFVFYRRLRHY